METIMNEEEIKLELFKRRKRVSMASIARKHGKSRSAVLYIIRRQFVNEAIMNSIAEAIERDPKYVFPEHFLKAS